MHPTIAPKTIGRRNLKCFFTLLKNPKILSNNFSYKPTTIQITPLLIPGRIAPAPIKMPFIKLDKDCI